ncbi:reverse transcriptase-like protein [Sphingomonas profundi]|uniref:reverse transcriptase-like protein n=1 Tax=Alterirhizorhabdus profundi TaxID=2681549 RepID=UPI0012E6FEF7|nr:reverse transcriptase-like protein [Sphingomonas profundi]
MSRRPTTTRIFFDGGCRPNPGPIEVAAVVRGVAHIRDGLGCGDNNVAEWLALRHAADIACALGLDDVEFVGDSTVVVEQASGRRPCRSGALRAQRAAFAAAVAGIARVRLRHVPRSRNLAGIALDARRR